MNDSAQTPIRASTQEHLSIEDIDNDLVILKDGSCALVLSVSSVNFDLLSEREQEALIYAYGALLNSLSFPIQLLVRSQRKDISRYLESLAKQETLKAKSTLLAGQIGSYRKFVADMVKKNNVLDKKFFAVIPFSSLEMGVAPALTSIIVKRKGLPYPKEYILEKAKIALLPKKDQLSRLFGRLGLVVKQLDNKELTKLFYSIYNGEALTSVNHTK